MQGQSDVLQLAEQVAIRLDALHGNSKPLWNRGGELRHDPNTQMYLRN